eukprot:2706542-Amphidinium_carterae.1
MVSLEQTARRVYESAQQALECAELSPSKDQSHIVKPFAAVGDCASSQAKDPFCHRRHACGTESCGNSFLNFVPCEEHGALPRRKSILSFTGFCNAGALQLSHRLVQESIAWRVCAPLVQAITAQSCTAHRLGPSFLNPPFELDSNCYLSASVDSWMSRLRRFAALAEATRTTVVLQNLP